MDYSLHSVQPLLHHAPPCLGPIVAALRRQLSCVLAAKAPRPEAPCEAAPDVPAAIGATDAELLRLASELSRDPADSIWDARSALTLLGFWKS